MSKLSNRINALNNIERYETEEDLLTGLNLDDMEEFNDNVESGLYQNLTLGTYNGALNKTTYRKMTEEHMLTAILIDSIEDESIASDLALLGSPDMTDSETVLFYTETWNVFTFDGLIYMVRD